MLSLLLSDVAMIYPGLPKPVLDIDEFTIPAGEQVAITGASGSGKSTLVNLITGLERPSRGRVKWNGLDLSTLSETGRDRWRGANIGLIMQDFHLFPGLSALDNVLLPSRLARCVSRESIERAHELLERVGLSQPRRQIETMSRGEMQRIAVARALLRKPGVIVADEPTASLDPENGEAVGDLLLELASGEGSTLIVVSHDRHLINRLSRRIEFVAGRIVRQNALESAA